MKHADHVELLRPAHLKPGGEWADLGAGSGAFTLALRELLGPTSTMHAIDKDASALRALEREYARRFGDLRGLRTWNADFTKPLELAALDGVLMANSLHFYREKIALLETVRRRLKPDGRLLIVEYNADKGNTWVPFPFTFGSLKRLAAESRFTEPELLATHPSHFLREIYAASMRVGPDVNPRDGA